MDSIPATPADYFLAAAGLLDFLVMDAFSDELSFVADCPAASDESASAS